MEKKILVEALDTYEKNSIKDNELKRIPKTGEQFEVTEERLNTLLGNNDFNLVFVKVIENIENIDKDGNTENNDSNNENNAEKKSNKKTTKKTTAK